MMTPAKMTWKMTRTEAERIHLLLLLDHAGAYGDAVKPKPVAKKKPEQSPYFW